MATLEKIRSKSVFLIIVIGVALLAFIVGDAITNGSKLFGNQTTVAKVGKQKIDYTEYQRKRQELNNQLEEARRQNPQQYANFDTQILAQMALEQLVGEKLLDDAVDKAGVRSTGNQLRFYMLENPINEKINLVIRQLMASGVQVSTPAQAYEIIFNPKRNGLSDADMAPFQRQWLAVEEETKQMIARNTYQRLLYGTVKANELDKKSMYNDYVATADVEIAFKPFGQLDEKKYPVSASEINDRYKQERYRFEVMEPTKEVSFIAVNVVPSAADIKNAKALAQKAVKALRDSTLGKDMRREGVVVERRQLRASDISNAAIKSYVASAPADSVSLISETPRGFTIVKMGSRRAEVDSIQVNIVSVAGAALPAKVLATLNSGIVVDSIKSVYKTDSVTVQPKQWIQLFTAAGPTNAIEKGQLDTLLNAGGRYVELFKSNDGAVYAQVADKKAPVEVYEYEEINYDVKPSVRTVSDERAKLEKFLAANSTAAKFKANAAKAGYNVQEFDFTQSLPAVPRFQGMNQYYPDSRQVVRWVMIDGNKGGVSHIYESKDANAPALYAVAVDSEYEDFIPADNKKVKDLLTGEVRASKAGDAMVKQYQAKASSVASAAAAMGVQSSSSPAFRFGRNYSVSDPAVTGRISGTNPGAKVYVVKGADGVYAYRVKSRKNENFPYNADSYEQQYYQLVNPDMQGMLRGDRKIVNNVYKFEAGD
jgi:peptidyl-prolyl cis-trans isomerase D